MFTPEKSVLLVIDVQGKLAYLMHEKDQLFRHIRTLVKAADILNIPVIFTEQAPHKIGVTVPEVAALFGSRQPIKKAHFSCCDDPKFLTHLKSLKRKQAIICGIETHVCIMQTVTDLLAMQMDVQVVADAVSSRTAENKHWALKRMESTKAVLTSTEMIVTELLRTSAHPKFKQVLELIR